MSLSLKVEILAKKTSRTLPFSPGMSVAEALSAIRDRTGEGGMDHGLFLPATESQQNSKGKWMRDEKLLQNYDLKNGDTVYYKKKHGPLKVMLADAAAKTILLDMSLPVERLVEGIGQKMNIEGVEEFSLKKAGSAAGDWLNPKLNLLEQGVDPEEDTVILRQKFFVNDGNIKKEDAVQLHLFYSEARDQVLSGKHVLTESEAVQFASLQAQIVLGNHNPDIEKSLKVKDYLSPYWAGKLKKPEALIVKEWKTKYLGLTEAVAKFRYLQLFRSLKTYGYTFFTVKEKRGTGAGKKKIKTLPVLLGINKDTIVRFDPDTRETLQTWPMNHLRRWNANPTSFTFDFGDYETEYYVVATMEGEAISQLISGYIDLLLKMRQKGAAKSQESTGVVATEEMVGANMGSAGVAYASGFGQPGFMPQVQQYYYQMMNTGFMPLQFQEQMPMGQMGTAQGMALEGGQMLMMNTDLDSASSAVFNMLQDFSTPLSSTQLNLADFQPQAVVQDISVLSNNMHSCVIEMLNGLQNVEMTSINAQASKISYNVAAMMQRAKLLGGAEGGDTSLLNGAKNMSEAISQLLMCSKIAMENPNDAGAMNRLNEATQNFEIASCFMNAACAGMLVDDASSQLYLESARAVSCSLEDMLFECQNIELIPPAQRMQVEYVSKNLMATATMLSHAMNEPRCQAQLTQMSRTAYETAQSFLTSARASGMDPSVLARLTAAATKVGEGINLLVNTQKCANSAVIDSVTNMQEEMEQMKRQVTLLSGTAGNGLTMQTYTTSTIDLTNKILAAARTAQRITRDPEVASKMSAQIEFVSQQAAMFATSSQAALSNPRDPSAFGRLLEAAKGLINASQQMLASTTVQPPNHYDVLRTSCKSSAATITNLVVSAKTAVRTVADPTVRTAVLTEAVQTETALNRLVGSLIQSASDPNNQTFNNTLFNVARELSRPTAKLVELTSKVLPSVTDEQQKQALKTAATNSQKVLQELIAACKQVSEASGGGAIDEALSKIQISVAELDSAIVEVDSGTAIPTSKADRDGTLAMVENAVRNLAGGVKKVTETSVRGGPELAAAVQATASGIGEIILSAKQLASVVPDLKTQSAILTVAKQAVSDSVQVIEHARSLSANPTDPNLGASLRGACASLGQSINKVIPTCRSAGSGSQECDQAAQAIAKETEKLTATAIVTQDKTFPQTAVQLNSLAKGLSAAVLQLSTVAKQANRDTLPVVVNGIASNMPHLIAAASAAATLSPTASGKTEIVEAAKKVGQATARIIAAAKVGNTPEGAKHVDASLQAYNEAVTGLLNSLDAATPGQQELNDSMQLITSAISTFTISPSGTASVSGVGGGLSPQRATMGSANNMKDLLSAAKNLADSIGRIVATTRTAPEKAGPLMKQAAASISTIFETFDASAAENKQLTETAKNVAEATAKMVEVLKQVVSNPKERNNQTALASVAQTTGDAIKQLMAAAKMTAPGQRECEQTMEKIQESIEDLGSASINVTVGLLDLLLTEPCTKSSQQLQVEIASTSKQIAAIITQLPKATPVQYVTLVPQLAVLIPALSLSTKQLVCATTDPAARQEHIEKSKAVADSAFSVVQALKMLSAEPDDPQHRKVAADAALDAQGVIEALVATHSASLGVVAQCEESLTTVLTAAAALKSPGSFKSNKSYQQCQDDLNACTKSLASKITDLVRTSRTDAEKMGGASKDVANIVPNIINATLAAVSTLQNPATQKALLAACDDVVAAVKRLLESGVGVVVDPKSTKAQNAVSSGFKDVTDSIAKLINSLREGATGYKQCDSAVESVVSVIADLDAAALFAASGQMDVPIAAGTTLETSQNKLIASTKTLREAVKQLAASSETASQEALGQSAVKISQTVSDLAKESKISAALLSDVLSQQEILASAKTVLEVSQQLILNGKEAQARPEQASKDMFRRTNELIEGTLQQLTATLEKAAADVILSIRELEKARSDIQKATSDALAGKGPTTQATAEEVVKALRSVAGASAALVAAGNSNETIEAAREAAKFNTNLIAAARGTQSLGDAKTTTELLSTIKGTSDTTCALLEILKTQRRDDIESQKKVSAASAAVADAVNVVLNVARKLPGGKNLELEDNDLEKIAEKELLAAMEAIEKAAKRLAPKKERKEGEVRIREEELAEGITDAAREITVTAKNLIQAATAVQKEIQAKGKDSKAVSPYKKDPAWAQGLISAAKAVAGTTEDLVIASNEAIKKTVGEEVIIAATRGVAGATARLVAASRAKADPNSAAQQKLTDVAKKVAEATAHLSTAARANFAPLVTEEEGPSDEDAASYAKSRIQELNRQAEIANLEMKLKAAREGLAKSRKEEYSGSGSGSGSGSPAVAPAATAAASPGFAKAAPAAGAAKASPKPGFGSARGGPFGKK